MSSLTYDICLVYLDDILVFSKTFEEHCDRLTAIFDRLKLKPTKCYLFQWNVNLFMACCECTKDWLQSGQGSHVALAD